MNTMVAARVPVEIKEQGDLILRNLGSNPTETGAFFSFSSFARAITIRNA